MTRLPEIKPGNWYFVVTCPKCRLANAVGLAPPPTQSSLVYPWPVSMDCECGEHTNYPAEEVHRIQAKARP
jgi:hypothetical protein